MVYPQITINWWREKVSELGSRADSWTTHGDEAGGGHREVGGGRGSEEQDGMVTWRGSNKK